MHCGAHQHSGPCIPSCPIISPCIPSPPLSHAPSHIAVAFTTATATAIATVTAITEAQHGNAFSPWDSDDALPWALETQGPLTVPCRSGRAVSAIAMMSRKGELTPLGSKGPL